MENYTLSHIAAAGLNNVIGRRGKLPWTLPEDLKFFHNKTKGRPVIMGRKTFESLGRPLEGRVNIVISRNKNFNVGGVYPAPNLDEAVKLARQKFPKNFQEQSVKKEIFIIGGGEIYKQSLHKVQTIYLTRVHEAFEGDAFYPEVSKKQFREAKRQDREGNPPYSFLIYEKIK